MEQAACEEWPESPSNQCPLMSGKYTLLYFSRACFLNQQPMLGIQCLHVQVRVPGGRGKEKDQQSLLRKMSKCLFCHPSMVLQHRQQMVPGASVLKVKCPICAMSWTQSLKLSEQGVPSGEKFVTTWLSFCSLDQRPVHHLSQCGVFVLAKPLAAPHLLLIWTAEA